jgi:hypothetical protein
MAKSEIISHWSKHFRDFETSSLECYTRIEAGIEAQKLPDTRVSRTEWRESGVMSAPREYLRVRRQGLQFDVCAAPFGTGYFFSWWLTRERRWGWVYTIVYVIFAVIVYALVKNSGSYHYESSTNALMICFVLWWPVLFLGLGAFVRAGFVGRSSDAAGAPLYGWLYERIFYPSTYFESDTMIMFQGAVHSAVLDAVDALTTSKGLRALSEDERKPVMRNFTEK